MKELLMERLEDEGKHSRMSSAGSILDHRDMAKAIMSGDETASQSLRLARVTM